MSIKKTISKVLGNQGYAADYCQGLGTIVCKSKPETVKAMLKERFGPAIEVERLHSGPRLEVRINQ